MIDRRIRGPLALETRIERWPLTRPFHITGYVWNTTDVLCVCLAQDGYIGRGEASGVYYRGESPATMLEQLEALRPEIERGISRDVLRTLLPSGGARNALDCALWDLEAHLEGRPVWQIAGLDEPRPLLTTFTCGAGPPEEMAATAHSYLGARALKLKLTGEPDDAARIQAVRAALPEAWLAVDANQGFTPDSLNALMPVLEGAGVSLIEQPFPMAHDAWLDEFVSCIPIAADESVQGLSDMRSLCGRFQVVNIKLDKCGGLTEGLAIAREAREVGLEPMIGNMTGTSLAMAPAFLIGQLCTIVDLDGPVFLRSDRPTPVQYVDGFIRCPAALWGYPDKRGGARTQP